MCNRYTLIPIPYSVYSIFKYIFIFLFIFFHREKIPMVKNLLMCCVAV